MLDAYMALVDSLIEQFRGKPRIDVLIRAIAKQFQRVADFYAQLQFERSLDTAVGAQLDRIGDIVRLTRNEAIELSGDGSLGDEQYRLWLKYKALANISRGQYGDFIAAAKMFVGPANTIRYTERPDFPAMARINILAVGAGQLALLDYLKFLKAAGVQLEIVSFRTWGEVLNKDFLTWGAMLPYDWGTVHNGVI